MSHQHSAVWRKRPFRAFVINQYYANRDEYSAHQQVPPYTFEQYYVQNLSMLKQQYRQRVANLSSQQQ